MTSEEALEQIRKFKPFGYDNDNKEEYPLSGTLNDYLEEELDTIKKDLEILEKLKSILKVNDYNGYISFYTNGYRNDKDILEIKEWLENKK